MRDWCYSEGGVGGVGEQDLGVGVRVEVAGLVADGEEDGRVRREVGGAEFGFDGGSRAVVAVLAHVEVVGAELHAALIADEVEGLLAGVARVVARGDEVDVDVWAGAALAEELDDRLAGRELAEEAAAALAVRADERFVDVEDGDLVGHGRGGAVAVEGVADFGKSFVGEGLDVGLVQRVERAGTLAVAHGVPETKDRYT